MLNKILIGAGLALCVAACATNPSTSGPAAAAKQPPGWCVSSTGTRIPMSQSECTALGHTWTQDQIQTTGATDAAQALRQLDPSLTIRGQ
jgi:hypothetical protein